MPMTGILGLLGLLLLACDRADSPPDPELASAFGFVAGLLAVTDSLIGGVVLARAATDTEEVTLLQAAIAAAKRHEIPDSFAQGLHPSDTTLGILAPDGEPIAVAGAFTASTTVVQGTPYITGGRIGQSAGRSI